MKKVLSLLLSVCLLFSLFPISVQAVAPKKPAEKEENAVEIDDPALVENESDAEKELSDAEEEESDAEEDAEPAAEEKETVAAECCKVKPAVKEDSLAGEKASKGYADKYVDLHLHLDGAITPSIAKILAEKQNIKLPAKTDADLEKLLQVPEDCPDLNTFLDCFELPCSLIQTAEGISEAVYQVLEDARTNGVIYAELRFAPSKCCDKGLTQEEAVEAALEGLKRSELKANLILCCMRGDDEKTNRETVDVAAKYLVEDGGVVALDLAGAEALFPTADYEEIFAYASEMGVPFTIHAGEAAGAESVKLAVEFGAKRIGHGVTSVEDPELLELLKEKGVTLEMCPTSNRLTHAVEDMSEYPFMYYLQQGISITLNTDDPAIENTTLASEYRYMEDNFGLTSSMEKRLLCNSVNAAFTSEEVKAELREELGLPYEAPKKASEDVEPRLSPYVENAGEKNKIILDTDICYGNDDAANLFLTLYEENQGNCKIMGITTVGGNATVAESTCAVLRMLEMLDRTDIPVYEGYDEPMMGYRDLKEDGKIFGKAEWYGAYWDFSTNDFRVMEGHNRDYLKLDADPKGGYPDRARAADGDAVDFIIKTIHDNPGEVTIFIMGAGTNLALALEKDPTIVKDAAGVVYMGGAVDVKGNSTSAAEFNWWYDPAGIQKCLEAGWKTSILIPNDIAEKVTYTKEIYDAIASTKSESIPGAIMAEADYERFYGNDNTPPFVWDALIALAYFHPDKLTSVEERYILCETNPGYNYGRTVSWWNSRNRDVATGDGMPSNATKIPIVTEVDEEFFWDYYVKGNSW